MVVVASILFPIDVSSCLDLVVLEEENQDGGKSHYPCKFQHCTARGFLL